MSDKVTVTLTRGEADQLRIIVDMYKYKWLTYLEENKLTANEAKRTIINRQLDISENLLGKIS